MDITAVAAIAKEIPWRNFATAEWSSKGNVKIMSA